MSPHFITTSMEKIPLHSLFGTTNVHMTSGNEFHYCQTGSRVRTRTANDPVYEKEKTKNQHITTQIRSVVPFAS